MPILHGLLKIHVTRKYIASKILQERAVFDFIQRNKATLSFDAVSLVPVYVLGVRILHGAFSDIV